MYNKLFVVVTRPLPRDGGMTEDHGPPEARQLSRDKSLMESCVCCSEDERRHSKRAEEAQVPE